MGLLLYNSMLYVTFFFSEEIYTKKLLLKAMEYMIVSNEHPNYEMMRLIL